MSVALETALDEFTELGSEQFAVIQMVNAQTRSGSLRGVCRADAFLCGSNTETLDYQEHNLPLFCITLTCFHRALLPSAHRLLDENQTPNALCPR